MTRIKGERLYVNLGASQVRKRLRGFGHGVRKVQSVGTQQAMLIHTATGEHLRALLARFADVPVSDHEADLTPNLEQLRNLGPKSAQWLRAVGIQTPADLEQSGPCLAYRRVRQQFPQASLNLLWALAGAVQDRDERDLSDAEKLQLRRGIAAE